MNALGECKNCHGDLCVGTLESLDDLGRQIHAPEQVVKCERCGQPQPEHPMNAEFAAYRNQPAPRPVTTPAIDYVHSWGDRLLALEKRADLQDKKIAHLEAQLAASKRK
jgi:hypothetical protein